MTFTIGLVTRILDIVFGAIGLLLILRVVLQVFGMRWNHPVLQVVIKITDPLLSVTNRLLGIPTYRSSYRSSGGGRSDMLSVIAAVVALWAVRTVVVWALQLVILIPAWAVHPLTSIGAMLRYVLGLLFNLYTLALLVRVLFGWIQVPYTGRFMHFLWRITEPVLAPIRSLLPPLAGFDLSPLVAFFLLRLLEQVVLTMVSWIFR